MIPLRKWQIRKTLRPGIVFFGFFDKSYIETEMPVLKDLQNSSMNAYLAEVSPKNKRVPIMVIKFLLKDSPKCRT